MDNVLEYKGYHGSVEFSVQDGILHGRVLFIRDGISYEGKSVRKIKAAFQEAVDDYLQYCDENGRKPDAPMNDGFHVNPGRDLLHRIVLHARQHDMDIHTVVCDALRLYLDPVDGNSA